MPASQTARAPLSLLAANCNATAGAGRFNWEQARWEEKTLRRLPPRWKRDALKRHRLTTLHQGLASANLALLDFSERFDRCRIPPGATDADVIEALALDFIDRPAADQADALRRWAP